MNTIRFDITLQYDNGGYGVVQNCALDYLNETIAHCRIAANPYTVRIDRVAVTYIKTWRV